MKRLHSLLVILILLAAVGVGLAPAVAGDPSADAKLVERGRYIARISGCNDCHTPGYIMNDGNIPEAQWLTGDNFGWRGPWGTTYGSNLRLFLKNMSEAQWIETAHTLVRRPPMPWYNLNAMNDDDLRALYHFIRSLGAPGEPAPAFVPPGEKPATPYAVFPSPTPAN
jgi:mono/diheme cytochrome c family protein